MANGPAAFYLAGSLDGTRPGVFCATFLAVVILSVAMRTSASGIALAA